MRKGTRRSLYSQLPNSFMASHSEQIRRAHMSPHDIQRPSVLWTGQEKQSLRNLCPSPVCRGQLWMEALPLTTMTTFWPCMGHHRTYTKLMVPHMILNCGILQRAPISSQLYRQERMAQNCSYLNVRGQRVTSKRLECLIKQSSTM